MTRGGGAAGGPPPPPRPLPAPPRGTPQLIVITNQKRTMEMADALYGVTMRDGVTTVVSQRLAD